jgi:transposase-like protein
MKAGAHSHFLQIEAASKVLWYECGLGHPRVPDSDILAALHTEEAAVASFTRMRWAHGPYCLVCGRFSDLHEFQDGTGRFSCASCKGRFTIRKNTIFEDSRLPLNKWFFAMQLFIQGITLPHAEEALHCTKPTVSLLFRKIEEAARLGTLYRTGKK